MKEFYLKQIKHEKVVFSSYHNCRFHSKVSLAKKKAINCFENSPAPFSTCILHQQLPQLITFLITIALHHASTGYVQLGTEFKQVSHHWNPTICGLGVEWKGRESKLVLSYFLYKKWPTERSVPSEKGRWISIGPYFELSCLSVALTNELRNTRDWKSHIMKGNRKNRFEPCWSMAAKAFYSSEEAPLTQSGPLKTFAASTRDQLLTRDIIWGSLWKRDIFHKATKLPTSTIKALQCHSQTNPWQHRPCETREG